MDDRQPLQLHHKIAKKKKKKLKKFLDPETREEAEQE
jgi:hypothetical protein